MSRSGLGAGSANGRSFLHAYHQHLLRAQRVRWETREEGSGERANRRRERLGKVESRTVGKSRDMNSRFLRSGREKGRKGGFRNEEFVESGRRAMELE